MWEQKHKYSILFSFLTIAPLITPAPFLNTPRTPNDLSMHLFGEPFEGSREYAWHVDRLKYKSLPKQFTGQGIVVAVIDTEFNFGHKALEGQYWTNPKEVPGNKIDDDRNGYVDDVNGYDFRDNDNDPGFHGDTSLANPTMAHATHITGVIVAKGSGVNRPQGIAQGARVMPLKILSQNGAGSFRDAIRAIHYAIDNGAQIINLSTGCSPNQLNPEDAAEAHTLFRKAMQHAADKKVLVVAAAGNSGLNFDQAKDQNNFIPQEYVDYWNLVKVASTAENGVLSNFSNHGKNVVQIAAPGEEILSTALNQGYLAGMGTSVSAPIVAGLLARALSAGMTPQDALEKLKTSVKPNSYLKGLVGTGGIVNPYRFFTDN